MPTDLVRINLDLLYPPFTEKVLELAARCRAKGRNYYLNIGYRSPEEQLALWQKGRNEAGAVVDPKKVVTKLRVGAHNFGIAVDFCADADPVKPGLQPSWSRDDYTLLAEEAVKLGLEAGHYWAGFPDSPHVQLPIAKHHITLSMLHGLYSKLGKLSHAWALLDAQAPW